MMTLEAKDVAGQTGRSQSLEMILPERQLTKPCLDFYIAAHSAIPALLARVEELEAKLDRWRNCFICIECGRGKVDGDGLCSTCGRDCLQFVDGRMIDNDIVNRLDALEDEADDATKLRALLRTACAIAAMHAPEKRDHDCIADLKRQGGIADE